MGARLALLKVDGVVSVKVRVFRNTIRVAAPKRADIVLGWQSERVGVLAETVEEGILW